jgi:pimeloyl-ACP methyl ester carboxylesterase
MKNILMKTLKWISILLGTLTVFIMLLRLEIIGNPMVNMSFRYSDAKIMEKFAENPTAPSIGRMPFEQKEIRYLLLERDISLPYVVFIHGAPGSLIDYLDFFKDEKLSAQYNLLSIDRLGYGYSDFGQSETSMKKQAAALMEVVHSVCKNNKVIVVGHSYGGPVALMMEARFPRTFKSILLLAPAIDPENEKEIRIAGLGVNPLTSWLVPPALRVAAAEKTTHISELEKLEPLLRNINIPICHMHGTKDSLVPYENVAFSEKHFSDHILEIVTLEKVDHFLPWTHHELIVDKLVQMNPENSFE